MKNKKNVWIALIAILVIIFGVAIFTKYTSEMSNMSQNESSGTMGNMQINSEEDFIKNMIPHHNEAIETSKIVNSKTNGEELKNLTQNIISAQESEVSIMENVLNKNYSSGSKVSYNHMMDENLSGMTGSMLEKTYLEGMINHHSGAIEMAKKAKKTKLSLGIEKIVDNVIATQADEINKMKEMLKNYN